MATSPPHWRFAAMPPAQMNVNPVQGEFFSSASDLPERLVREAIQNSLDAALREPDGQAEVVRVRFAFSDAEHELPAVRAARYLDGLRKHVNAVAENDQAAGYSQVESTPQSQAVAETRASYEAAARLDDQPMRYLVVEDFGTSGLTGEVGENGANAKRNNFWGFFRQIGISPKGENDAGSWGLGKWVFPDASGINSLLALTRREHEDATLMMGLAILKTHTIGDDKYPPYGHFVRVDERRDTEWEPMPVSSGDQSAFIEAALEDFRLQRGARSGLSVVIPWPSDELTPSTIARAVVTQYFLPIVKGALEIEIESPDEERRVINNKTIEWEVQRIAPSENDEVSPESMLRLLQLVRWAIQQRRGEDHISLRIPTANSNPLTDPKGAIYLDQLRERYNNNEPLAFELSLDVRRAGADHRTSVACYVYLQRDDSLERGHDYFVRGHLNIPDMDHMGGLRARALLLVPGDTELGHLLRDAENPAHTNWRPRDRAGQNWYAAGPRILEVRRAPQRLVGALVERPAERQMDALADLFPSDVGANSGSSSGNSTGGGGRTNGPVNPPPPETAPVRLQGASGGFTLVANQQFPVKSVDTTWRVRFAYELARGSKNKAFSLFEKGVKDGCPDFSVRDGIGCQTSGCAIDVVADNELKVRIESEQFQLSVSGFDPNRDVLVEVDRDKSEELTEAGDEGEAA